VPIPTLPSLVKVATAVVVSALYIPNLPPEKLPPLPPDIKYHLSPLVEVLSKDNMVSPLVPVNWETIASPEARSNVYAGLATPIPTLSSSVM